LNSAESAMTPWELWCNLILSALIICTRRMFALNFIALIGTIVYTITLFILCNTRPIPALELVSGTSVVSQSPVQFKSAMFKNRIANKSNCYIFACGEQQRSVVAILPLSKHSFSDDNFDIIEITIWRSLFYKEIFEIHCQLLTS